MAAATGRPVLVTGGAGFIGCNLVDRLAREGHRVVVFDALVREGVERNLDWLKRTHPRAVSFMRGDIRDRDAVAEATRDVGAVFHLAAQVAVTTSLVEPDQDFAVNVGGTLHLLEALRRRNDRVPLIFASTNKVYGDLADVPLVQAGDRYTPQDRAIAEAGIGETRPLDFHTPYGCSKGAADQYVLDYSRSFGVPTCVMRMSCIYGPHQMGTEDQGWLAHFVIRALSGIPISLFGDGRQVRDVLHVDDAVGAYLAAWTHIDRVGGRAFNIGGGPANAISLVELISFLGEAIGRPVETETFDWRAGDQRYFVADMRAALRDLALPDRIGWRDGVRHLVEWLSAESPLVKRARPAMALRAAQ